MPEILFDPGEQNPHLLRADALFTKSKTTGDRKEGLEAAREALLNALQGLNDVLPRDPDDPLVLKFLRVVDDLSANSVRPEGVESSYEQLLEASESGQCDDTERIASQILTVAPTFIYTHIVRGDCYFHNRDFEEALKRYEQAVVADPGYGLAYARIAECHDRLGHDEKALSSYIHSVIAAPGSPSLTDSLATYAYDHSYKVLLHRVERMARVMITPEGEFKIVLEQKKNLSKDVSVAWVAFALQKLELYAQEGTAQTSEGLQPSFEIERRSFELLVDYWREEQAKNSMLHDVDLDFLLQLRRERLLDAFIYICYFRPEFEDTYRKWLVSHQEEVRTLVEKYLVVVDPNQVKFKEGMNLFGESKYEQAFAVFREAAQGFIDSRDPGIKELLARCLNLMGRAARILGRTEEALSYQIDALKMLHEMGSPAPEVRVLNSLALTMRELGRMNEAQDYFQMALSLTRAHHDAAGEEMTLTNLGDLYLTLGKADLAQSALQEALTKSQKLARGPGAALLSNLGAMSLAFGGYQQAIEFYEKGLAVARAEHDQINEITIDSNMGVLEVDLGQFDKARSHLRDALALAVALKDRESEAAALNNLGDLAIQRKDFRSALQVLFGSYAIKKEIKDRPGEALALLNLGGVSAEIGDRDRALKFWNDGLKVAREIQSRQVEAAILTNLAAYETENAKEQLAYLETALSLVSTKVPEATADDPYPVPRRENIVDAETAMAVLMQRGVAIYKLARAARGDSAAPVEGRYLRCAGSSLSLALELVEQRRQGNGPPGIETQTFQVSYLARNFRAFAILVGVYLRLHELEPAHHWDSEAFKFAERTKSRTLLDLLNESKVKHFSGIVAEELKTEKQYELRIGALETQSATAKGKAQEALRNELQEALTAFEAFKKHLRERYPRYASLKYMDTASVNDVQAAIDDDSALIEYFVGDDFIAQWLIKKGQVRLHVLSQPKPVLGSLERYLRALARANSSLDLQDGQTLYASLIAPFENDLKGITRLIIVPDGELCKLPFQALVSDLVRRNPTYLVEKYAISYAQSTSVLILLAQQAEPGVDKRKLLFAMGRPSYSARATAIRDSRRGGEIEAAAKRGEEVTADLYEYYLGQRTLIDLPATETEVDQIGALLGSTEDTFKGDQATEHRVKDYSNRGILKTFKYVHFAAHGLVSDEIPALTAVALAKDEADDGFLTVGEVYGLDLGSDLVTLSACGLGLGKVEKGEGVIGLTRAFLYAGTSAITVSLWSVADTETAELMTQFYKNLTEGVSLDRALQQAQITMIHQTQMKTQDKKRGFRRGNSAMASSGHPFFWAPFVLYGISK